MKVHIQRKHTHSTTGGKIDVTKNGETTQAGRRINKDGIKRKASPQKIKICSQKNSIFIPSARGKQDHNWVTNASDCLEPA